MSAGTKDYYAILGIERDASDGDIKRAFRAKARETHPDVNNEPDAEERFKELNEAYDVLSDPAKRDTYDRFGTVDPRFGAAGAGPDLGDFFAGFGMDDLFSAFFGAVNAGSRRVVRYEGRDMATAVTITLEEAATGTEKQIVVDHLAPCDVCHATGVGPGGKVVTCPQCGGTGQQRSQRRTFIGVMESVQPCEMCGQTGHIIDTPCQECQGTGRLPDRERITVAIPPAVSDGARLRVAGYGEAGVRGAAPGDLVVTVRIQEHEFLHREGDDLHCRASVTMTQAALGADLKACGLLEDTEIHVPGGSQFGDVVKVKGEGMPRARGSGRGDLFVHLAVEVPKKLSKRQRELLTELSSELGDDASTQRSPLQRLREWFGG